MSGEPRRPTRVPGRTLYAVAAGILAAGALLLGLFLFLRVRDLGAGFQRLVVPGETELTLPEPGSYTVFLEHRSVVDGRVFVSPPEIPGLRVQVAPAGGGAALPVREAHPSMSYSFGSREGVSVLAFDVEEPGAYRLRADFPEDAGGPAVLAVGRGLGRGLVVTVLGALAIGFTAFAAAATLAVTTFLRRRRAAGPRAALPSTG